jgi:uncharacterized protein
MVVNAIDEKECRAVLARTSLGRLGCSLDGKPYVLPVYFASEADYLYVLSTFGQKIEWMRANPKVCVQVDEIVSESEWVSVIVNGRYEELIEPQYDDERARARKLLEKRYLWWQTPFAERQLRQGDTLIGPVFFRVLIDSLTGLCAVSESLAGTVPQKQPTA